MSGLLLAALVALPVAAGALLCLAPLIGPARRPTLDRWSPWLATGVAAVVLAAAGGAAAVRPTASWAFLPGIDGGRAGLGVDDLSAAVLVTVCAVALLVLASAALDAEERPARFSGLMLLFTGAVTLTASATTLPALLLGWEVMGATSYALIGLTWSDPVAVRGGETAFLTTRAADLGLYLAGGAALAGGAGLALDGLPTAGGAWLHVAAAGVLVAALGKAAQLPFSAWLSRAMEGPSPVSALLHSAAMVAMGGYLLLRTAPLLAATGWAGPVTAWVGAVTTVALGAVALAQTDLKQLLAASTAAQLGFVVLAAGLSAPGAGATQLVAHAAVKAGLFLAAGAWLTALGSKHLAALRGAARRWPVLGGIATAGFLALAGVPPLALWATKDAVLSVAHEESLPLYLVGLAGAGLSAAYAGTALAVLWSHTAPAPGDDERHGTGQVPRAQLLPLGVLALGAVGLGGLAWGRVGPGELAVSGALALVVLLVVVRFGAPAPRWAAGWLGLQPATDALVVRPVQALAAGLARFDDRVLHARVLAAARGVTRVAGRASVTDDAVLAGAVAGLAGGTARGARGAAALDDRGVAGAVAGLARGARGLGVLARRPQTGLLHQYYIQVAVVLAAGLLLLIVVR